MQHCVGFFRGERWVLQGILQGESIPKIAARMQKVTGSNAKAAVRTARTAVTEAENRGRQDSYKRAKKDGVMLQRKWIATYDMRTRHAHALLDGQLAEVDEPFESELGPIMFPGDHTAHPSNVYNCRCTLGVKYLGFDGKKTKIKSEDNRPLASELVKKKTAQSGLTNGGKNDKIILRDIQIGKSVGAKALNYEILDPLTGEYFKLVEGSRIRNAEVFAGKGVKKALKQEVAEGLSREFGGTPSKWQHAKGIGTLEYHGEELNAEIHWFQEETVGKVKFKVKEWVE